MKRLDIPAVSFVLLVCSLASSRAIAYTQATHRYLSEASYDQSALEKDAGLRAALGVQLNDKFPDSKAADGELNVRTLIGRGAIYEDNGWRSANHFYDPVNGSGLRVGSALVGVASPDWELADPGTYPALPDPLFAVLPQKFSYADARGYEYSALTASKKSTRDESFGLLFETMGHIVHHLQDVAQPQHVRNDAHCDECDFLLPVPFGGPPIYVDELNDPSLFEKDTDNVEAASKEHGLDGLATVGIVPARRLSPRRFWTGTDKGGIADYTNMNFVSKGTNWELSNGRPATTNYPLPVWDQRAPEYIDIQKLFAEDGTCSGTNAVTKPGCDLQGQVAFYGSEIIDNYSGSVDQHNPRASTLSVFDQYLQKYAKKVVVNDPNDPSGSNKITYDKIFTLNRFNFETARQYLIPKAVDYSAGMIDYFFRGRLRVTEARVTNGGISLRFVNAIDVKNVPKWKNENIRPKNCTFCSQSKLVVAYDYTDENGNKVYGASDPVSVSETIAPGKESAVNYNFSFSGGGFPADSSGLPPDVPLANFRLVYRGGLGQEEDAIAVGTFHIRSGFLVKPSATPPDGITGPRLIYRHGGTWHLSRVQGLQAGNVDWKGWYDSATNQPTEVLSWVGPHTRYFPEEDHWTGNTADSIVYSSPTSNKIYKDGDVFAIAPYPVLGAALSKDANGVPWLVAICAKMEGAEAGGVAPHMDADVVYRVRVNDIVPPALNGGKMDPNLWQLVATFPYTNDSDVEDMAADIPWFFNGDGTEAQTMRKWKDKQHIYSGIWQLKRLKISLSAGGAQATIQGYPEENLPKQTVVQCSSSWDDKGGSTTTSSTGEASFIIAVDYKNKKAVLGEVTEEENLAHSIAGTAGTSARPGHPGTPGTSNGSINDDYKVSFSSDGGSLTFPVLDQAVNGTYSSGSYDYDTNFYWRENTWYMDLRYDMYSYTEDGWTEEHWHNNIEGQTTPAESYTSTYTDAGAILSSVVPTQQLFGRRVFKYQGDLTWGEFGAPSKNCLTSSDLDVLGSNFGYIYPHLDGSWLVDTQGNTLYLQTYVDGPESYQYHFGYNYLENGDINQLFGTTGSGIIFNGVGVIH